MNHVERKGRPLTWKTASHGHPADISALEMSELGAHLTRCRVGTVRLMLVCAAKSVHEFVAAHFVTTIAAIAVLALLFRFLL